MNITEITSLLVSLKREIDDDYRASDDPDDTTPGMQVTVSTSDGRSWSYQTGDNSYSGACYGDTHWSVIYLYRDSNCRELAREAVNELRGMVNEERDIARENRARKRFAGRAPFTVWIWNDTNHSRFVNPYSVAHKAAYLTGIGKAPFDYSGYRFDQNYPVKRHGGFNVYPA